MSKILIVDDEIQFIKMAQIRLESNGYKVISANDGKEGLEMIRNENPDLIILDIMMPVMDGYAMLKELRKDDKIKDIPVIMCSGKVLLNDEEGVLKCEANAYIAKPFEPPVFLAKIEELLNIA